MLGNGLFHHLRVMRADVPGPGRLTRTVTFHVNETADYGTTPADDLQRCITHCGNIARDNAETQDTAEAAHAKIDWPAIVCFATLERIAAAGSCCLI